MFRKCLQYMWIGVCAVVAAGGAAGTAHALLYDLDFENPPHTAGFPPVVGAGPAVRHVISEINDGNPLVVSALGAMVDQPCQFDAWDGEGDQIVLELSDLPASDFYTLECDVLVETIEADAAFTILFDAPNVRNIYFDSSGDIIAFVGGVANWDIGNYNLGDIVHLRVDVDLQNDLWTIYVNGALRLHETFDSASALDAIRFSTDVYVGAPGCLAAIDNVTVEDWNGDAICDRLGFSDLPLGAIYNIGEEFVTSGVTVKVEPFEEDLGSCGAAPGGGFVRVGGANQACRSGKELEINNATANFVLGGSVHDPLIPYGEFGGQVSLTINGDCTWAENFFDLSGTVLGGVTITVFDQGVHGQSCGVVRLGGVVDELKVGGQELFVDMISFCHVCPDLSRSAFDDQSVGTSYNPGDTFISGAAKHTIRPFFLAGATCANPFAGGSGDIGNAAFACGAGNELELFFANDQIDFGGPVQWIALSYREVAGNVNLAVNGSCGNFTNMSDANGITLGGVTVWAVDYGFPGISCGTLYAVGDIGDFAVGGQTLFIDNIRTCPVGAGTTGVDPTTLPAEVTRLMQNAPNPMREMTTIRFDLPAAGSAQVTVHDVAGRLVQTLAEGRMDRGSHVVTWDGRDARGRKVPAGIYNYRVATAGTTVARRMVVLP